MKLKWPLVASILIVSSMWILSLVLWMSTPDDMQFAVHFDSRFQPDRFAGKSVGLLLLPALATGLTALFVLLPRIDPRAQNLAQSSGLYISGWIGALIIVAGAHVATLQVSFVGDASLIEQLPLCIGLLFLVLGYYFDKSRSNFFAGIRTPWTLSSEYSWARTNKLGGRLFMLTAVVVIASHFIADSSVVFAVIIGGALTTAAVTAVASYFFWKNDPDRR